MTGMRRAPAHELTAVSAPEPAPLSLVYLQMNGAPTLIKNASTAMKSLPFSAAGVYGLTA